MFILRSFSTKRDDNVIQEWSEEDYASYFDFLCDFFEFVKLGMVIDCDYQIVGSVSFKR